MSQKTITYNDFQDQATKIAEYLDSQYWEIDSNEKTATMKPRFSNLPNEVKVSGLSTADTRYLKFDGNSISLCSGAASSVTIGGNNFEHQKATVYVTSQTNVEISTSDICFNGGNYYDNISLSSGAADCTIYGGQGQDTIYNNDSDNGHVIQIKNGDGHKVLRGYTAKDSIQIMDDSTFTPTVFSPANNTDYFPVQIGNTQVSLQGNLLQVPCVKFLNKSGDLISSNTAGNGVIFKAPDVVIENSGLSTSVQGCNCSVTGTSGSDSIFTAYGGVTIDSIFDTGADYICNTNNSEYGNTYVFKKSGYGGGHLTSSIVGFNHEFDTLIIENTSNRNTWPDNTVSVSADDGACTAINLGQVLVRNAYNSGSFKITTQSAFYGEVFSYTRIDNGVSSVVTLPVVHTYSTNAPLTNEHFKNLNSTSTANLISKKPEAVITHKGNWTILPEGSGSTITCAGTAKNFMCHANNCSIQSSSAAENFIIDGNNNTLMAAGGVDTISLVSGSVNTTFGFGADSNAVIYGNGEGSNVFQIPLTNGSATVHNFNKSNDILYYAVAKLNPVFEAVSGGYSIKFQRNAYNTFTLTLLGVYSGDVIKCNNLNTGEFFNITVS